MADTVGIRWNEIKIADRQGNSQQGQSFGGGGTTNGDVAIYDANGNVIDGGVTLSSLALASTWIGEFLVGPLDGVNTTFAISHTPIAGTLNVYLNGERQTFNRWVTVSGLQITFDVPPISIDILEAEYAY